MAVITISHGTLSATQELASYLAEELQYRVIAREEVYESAKVYGIEETGLGRIGIVDGRPPSFWNRFSERRRQYLVCFRAALLDHVLLGRVVYLGHLAHLLLADHPRVLRVRLAAPRAYRIHRLQKERGLSEAEAAAVIDDVDERRMRWGQFLYGVDWRDPTHYDLIINPEKFSIRTAATVITESAQSPEFRATDTDIQRLRDARLGTVVEAALLRSARTRGLELEASADAAAGRVLVHGCAPGVGRHVWERDVRTTVAQVEGVRSVDLDVAAHPVSY